ncbi:MAG: peptidylprolyl isomerase [Parcubacteria group bacterium]|jgi:peptidyl-prolyl cis-trans isomerase B (cyclophilin B)
MKKILILSTLVIAVVTLSGCGNSQQAQDSNKIPDPITDPGGNISGMLNLKEKAQQDINDATNKENENMNNALNENNMDSNLKAPEANAEILKKYTAATIKTSMGDIKVKLDASTAPLTVTNFLNLAQGSFYNNTKFHRVIKGFMIQGGDPNSKNADTSSWGMGGPGYKFKDELVGTEKYPRGTLAMANSGSNTNGSQFFIVTASPEAPLPPSYTVFGTVTSGMDVALKIENVKTTTNDRPVENVTINSVEPLEK